MRARSAWNGVRPGMIDTDFHNIFTKPEVRQKVAAATPLGREGEARGVSDLVAFLACDQASFINGTNIEPFFRNRRRHNVQRRCHQSGIRRLTWNSTTPGEGSYGN